MLTLVLEDKHDIEKEIFGEIIPFGERVTLYNDNDPVGVAVFGISDNGCASVLYRVGILECVRDKRFGDFFIRSMLYKLSLSGMDILINEYNRHFEKFGFVKTDNGMRVKNCELMFPSKCGGGNHD